jgi:uncharacterized protein involved in exopolysaccharide biosynthesis
MGDFASWTQPRDPERATTLRDVLAPVFRHRRLVSLTFLGLFLGVVLAGLLLPKKYEAHMKILVRRERMDPVVTSESTAQRQVSLAVTEEELQSEVALLKSRDLLEKVVMACGLHERRNSSLWESLFRGEVSGTSTRIPFAVRRLEAKLEVELLKKTNLIEVTYGSPDPQLAARVLATLANLYLEKHVAVHRPPGAFDFFQQETEKYRQGLSAAEERLAQFSRENEVVSAQLEKEIALQRLNEFEATLNQTQAAIVESEKRIHALGGQLAKTSPRLTTLVRTSDNPLLLQQLKSTLLTLELRRTELLSKFEPDYRPVQEIEKEIAQTQATIAAEEKAPLREEATDQNSIYQWLNQELAKAKAERVSLQGRAAETAQVVRTYREKAMALGQKAVGQQELMRAAKAAEGSYLLYLNKREEARISDELDRKRIVNVAIAETATVPALPATSPWLFVLLGGPVAALLSVGAAFLADFLDPTLRTADEVEQLLNVSVLAAMPKGGR